MNQAVRRRAAAVRRWRSVSIAQLWRVAQAQWYLLRARLALAFADRGSLLRRAPRSAVPACATATEFARARRVALAVNRAAEYGLFSPTCLVRAIALERMLARDGVDGAVVQIGARARSGRTEMHAWVELAGCVVGEQVAHTRTFTPLESFTAAGPG